MNRALYIVLLAALVLMCGMDVHAARPVKNKESAELVRLQKHIKQHPGDIDAYCDYVTALLQAGDTIEAEKQLDYALKLRSDAPCLLTHKALICLYRGNHTQAVTHAASRLAVDTLLTARDSVLIDSLSDCCMSSLTMRLQLMQQRLPNNTVLPWIIKRLSQNEPDNAVSAKDTVRMSIPFTRTFDGLELKATLNGLRLKVMIDTTATESTISGVESLFLIKNEYVRQEDVINRQQVMVRNLEFENHITITNLLLQNKNGQEAPIILNLAAFDGIGKAVLNERKNCIEIY